MNLLIADEVKNASKPLQKSGKLPSTENLPLGLSDDLNASKVGERSGKLSTAGKILIGLSGGVALGLSVLCAPFVSPALRKHCLPYIPATEKQIKNIFVALKNRQGTLVDLGSGDGRIVIDAAKKGFKSHGVELNLWLVLYSKLRSLSYPSTKFYRKDLWKFNLRLYDNVVIFGVEQMMPDLETKILKECERNSVIVACRFPLPNLIPKSTIGSGIDTVWLYEVPK